MIRFMLIVCVWMSLCASMNALGYVKPRPPCTEKEGVVLYLDRWQRRECVGLEVSEGLATFSNALYGHVIKVPNGFAVSITTSLLFGFTLTETYTEGTWFTNYVLLDTFGLNDGIVHMIVYPV